MERAHAVIADDEPEADLAFLLARLGCANFEALAAAERALVGREAVGIASRDVKLGFVHLLEATLALGERQRAEELLGDVEGLPAGLRPPLLAASARRFRVRA